MFTHFAHVLNSSIQYDSMPWGSCSTMMKLYREYFQDVTHRCPSCSAILGRYRQIIISLMANFQNLFMKTFFYLNSFCDFWIGRKWNWCYRAFANCVKITISCQKHRNPILQFYTESIDSIRGQKRWKARLQKRNHIMKATFLQKRKGQFQNLKTPEN